jgi:hypothetical protein
LANVVSGIQQIKQTCCNSEATVEELKQRVAAEIGPFLGRAGAHILLEPVSQTADDLLSRIEPVLAAFLGKQAAAVLVSHVVDAAIVRI